MPRNILGNVLPALKRFAPGRHHLLWAVAVAAVLVLAVSLVVTGNARPGAATAAGRVLDEVAAAQTAAKDRSGGYASLWIKGNDATLVERGGNIRADGAEDVRSIECGTGWLAGVRADGKVYLRSNVAGAVEEDHAKVQLPDCISPEARDALLADLGSQKTWPEPDAARLDVPAEDPGFRPAYHLTPDQRWMNDPQRPFFLDGLWHYYYLYNVDYPEGNGTEWFHATSTDLVHWKNEGVAIEKFRNGLGDIETGSAVVDTEGTAGFGRGAVIAVLTQQHEGVQRQSLFYSTDNGYSFQNYEQNPVMDNPGAEHWRDPRIVRDESGNQWLMLLAEGHKIGFYTSPDLKQWTYVSAFGRDGLGILECPDFFQMDVDGDPAKRTWVLAASANGSEEGRTTGLAYWTGSWDGKGFTPEGSHQWLDAGSDFYAAVTWDDPRLTDGQRKASRHAIGWMNNWAYARQLPTEGWFGAASVVRDIRLSSDGGRPALVSTPTPALQALEGEPAPVPGGPLDGLPALPVPESGAFKADIELEKPASGTGEARMLLQSGGRTYATVGYDFEAGKAFIVRDGDAVAAEPERAAGEGKRTGPDEYRQLRAVDAASGGDTVRLTVYVDRSSVEVFVDGGRRTLTSLVFPPEGRKEARLAAGRGPVSLTAGTVTPLAAIR
ncbi:glycoside hydrolase family 32 protein [Pseudarthrobacter sp. NS4]|uniref:glycoside hydrolase family 32 protein n=1 Tax=Pseudarthrobacter sp. NS4 TaxID=2973976 RepID=UPI002163972A|nr:glycoside hydrolase family 32 protein [Pseudarthrobacter sp. NS4]